MLGWRSGSASALHAEGRGFKSLTEYHIHEKLQVIISVVFLFVINI